MGISPGGLERQRRFGPIFGREINHTRLEAGDPQFAIRNLQFPSVLAHFEAGNHEIRKSPSWVHGFLLHLFPN
jgi:hypothetical protein